MDTQTLQWKNNMYPRALKSKRTVRLGLIYGDHTRNYCFHVFRDNIRIALVHYHHGAKQLVVEPKGVAFTKETLVGLCQYLNLDVFRRQRRLGMSRIRRHKTK